MNGNGQNNQHYVIAGKTGSGKSVFGLYLLHTYFMRGWNIVYIDVEDKMDSFVTEPEKATVQRPFLYDEKKPLGRVTYFVPTMPGWNDETLEGLYEKALSTPYTLVYHDEIIGIATASQYPLGLTKLYAQGRKKNVIGAICTQRPVAIPRICLTQAGIIVCFKISDPEDAKIMAKRMYNPKIEQKDAWERYGFYILNELTMDKARYNKPLRKEQFLDA